ncbi:MAG: hypothetical protein K5679_09015 [Lachnospiraceae bacterium]|nr:hypothetical protein [Lachnospiraceae bacterium]
MSKGQKIDKQNIILFICLGLVAISYAFIMVAFRYIDGVSFTAWSVSFWDVLFSGNGGHDFTYSVGALRGSCHEGVLIEWLTFFPWIIWNFPLWLTHPLSKNPDVSGMRCVLWSKMFLVVCLVVLCIYVYKILMRITKNDFTFSLAGVLMVASSLEMLDSVAYAGQDEVVYLATLIIALHQFITGKKKSGLVFCVITVTLNPLMIIPIAVMFVTVEKRILILLAQAVICYLPTFLLSTAYWRLIEHQTAQPNEDMIWTFQSMMNTGTLDTTVGNTSIAVTVLIVLVFVAYMRKVSEEEQAETLIYNVSIAFFTLNFLTFSIWYRFCIYVPLFVMVIGLSKENRNIKVFLLELLFVARFIESLSNFYNFSYDFSSVIGIKLWGEVSGTVVDLTSLMMDNMLYVLRPIVLACGIILMVICNKRFKKELKFDIPWKIVTYLGACEGLALCVLVILKSKM